MKACDVCQEHNPALQKDLSHDVPSLPWFKVAVDIFEYHYYLLVADYFTKNFLC